MYSWVFSNSCGLLIVYVQSELRALEKNKCDFVFTLFSCCCEFYQSDRRGLVLQCFSYFNMNFKNQTEYLALG